MSENTGKERTITFQMPDEDLRLAFVAAGKAGMTLGELVAAFLNDLVDGAGTRGSDERMYANMWYDRCGFQYERAMTFLMYLLEADELEDLMTDRREMQKAMEEAEALSRDIEAESNPERRISMDLERREFLDEATERSIWMKERWDDYQRACPYGDKDYDDAVLAATSWFESMERAIHGEPDIMSMDGQLADAARVAAQRNGVHRAQAKQREQEIE